MADAIIGVLKIGEVVTDALGSLYGRFTGSDGETDENQHADESEMDR